MFAKRIRSSWVAVGSASCALLLGCAMSSAQQNNSVAAPVAQSVTIGQGGYYTIVLPPAAESAPYALTGTSQNLNQSGVVGLHQNYGQSSFVIPPIPTR